MSEELELSIVMPCLNEIETLETCILKAQRFLVKENVQGEIVIGDNGSTDGSIEVALKNGARVVRVPVLGYGAALISAIQAARGKFIIMGDSDDSYDFQALAPLLMKLREGHDLVMGNRFKGEIKKGAMPWKNRWIGNPILTGIGQLLFNTKIGDFHCGLRGFSKKAFEEMKLKSTGMEFASEMVIKSSLFGQKQAEVPITLSPDGRSRPPHLRPWRDGWRHLRLLFLFSPKWLFLYPGALMMFLGTILGLRIIWGTLKIGELNLDINSLIYAGALSLVGFQSINFAVFTKVFAIQEGLLPPDPRLNKAFTFINLERGLAIGGCFIILALAGLFYGLHLWRDQNFLELDPLIVVRITYPSAVSLILGFQIIFSSFFLSVLGLKLDRGSSLYR